MDTSPQGSNRRRWQLETVVKCNNGTGDKKQGYVWSPYFPELMENMRAATIIMRKLTVPRLPQKVRFNMTDK